MKRTDNVMSIKKNAILSVPVMSVKFFSLLLVCAMLTGCSEQAVNRVSGTLSEQAENIPPIQSQANLKFVVESGAESGGNSESVQSETVQRFSPVPATEPEPEPEPESNPTPEPVPEWDIAPRISNAEIFFEEIPERFGFSSGGVTWNTELFIAPDGTFTGMYHKIDTDDVDEAYPNGTFYICNFSGTFSQPEQVSEHCWRMYMQSLIPEDIPGVETYADGFAYVTAEPYGLEYAEEILVYLPGTLISDLPEGACSWLYSVGNILDYWCLYNVNEELAFAGYNHWET